MERTMIELTDQQLRAVHQSGESPPLMVDRSTSTVYVLLRKDVYDQLETEAYDDSPWTAEERDALAWEAGKHAGWEEMDEYDDLPEKQ
jgi:hypothetical protein